MSWGPTMRLYFGALLLLLGGCANDGVAPGTPTGEPPVGPADGAGAGDGLAPDAVGAADAGPLQDAPPGDAPIADGASGPDAGAEDGASGGGDSADSGDASGPGVAFALPPVRWSPALVGDVLVTVDALGLRAELLGAQVIDLPLDGDGVPTSPVVIDDGLLCWDVDHDGQLNPAKEDYNGDGQGTDADCALHPVGSPKGSAGVVVALVGEARCDLRAITEAGHPAWRVEWPQRCVQPARVGPDLLVPVVLGTGGVVRLVDSRTGAVKISVSVSAQPTAAPVALGDGRWAVPLVGAVAVVTAGGGAQTALSHVATVDLSPDRVTSVAALGDGGFAATGWRAGDTEGSLGKRIRVVRPGPAGLAEATFAIFPPGDIWAAPVVSGGRLVAGGHRWVGAFEVDSGAPAWSRETELGTVIGLTLGGDARVFTAEVAWGPTRAEPPGTGWRVVGFDPANPGPGQTLLEGTDGVATRWLSAPLLLCDLLIVQRVPDAVLPGERLVAKPCPGGLRSLAWARPGGDNGNRGAGTDVVDCSPGPGVAPCKAGAGCEVPVDCDDLNPCTFDTCISGHCSFKLIDGCCTEDAHCEDFDPCTFDTCFNNKCLYVPSPVCCESSTQCDDGEPCTVDLCDQGFCKNEVDSTLPGCCEVDSDCPFVGVCKVPTCKPSGSSVQIPIPSCCETTNDCNDHSPCTLEECVEHSCIWTPDIEKEGCCIIDAHCTPPDACKVAACNALFQCEYVSISGCCIEDSECDDYFNCTVDACTAHKCTHTLDVSLSGCCETDADCVVEGDPCILSTACVENVCEQETVECDDQDPCTKDECQDGLCVYTPDEVNCCKEDADCDDGDVCTVDACGVEGCSNATLEGCCVFDFECNDSQPATTEACVDHQCSYCQGFVFETVSGPVDIVVVVDQSTSMTDELPAVKQYMADLAAWIGAAGVDYHFVLVGTRTKGVNAICVPEPLAGPGCADSDRFTQVEVQVGSHNALQLVMDNIDQIEVSLRPDSVRHFLVITDDDSQVEASLFDFFLDGRPGFDGYVFHSIVGLDTTACAVAAGEQYLALSAQSGGYVLDVCTPDWTASFEQLGSSTLLSTTSFAILGDPLPGSLVVTIGGQLAVEGVDYTIDPETGRLTLLVPELLPSSTPITACYGASPPVVGPPGPP